MDDHELHKKKCADPIPLLDLKTESLPDTTVFYRFVSSKQVVKGRIDRINIEDKGMSVYAEGGPFGQIDIIKVMQAERLKSDQDFVGIIRLRPALFPTSEFTLQHDPYPFTKNKDAPPQEQHPNHLCVICKKSDTLIDFIINNPDWVLKPEDFQKLLLDQAATDDTGVDAVQSPR